jgi:hypothetical protein
VIPSTRNLRAFYQLLRKDAPEAAIGIAGAYLSILFITTSALFSGLQEYGLFGLGVVFGLIGAAGIGAPIYRAFRSSR